MTTLPSVGTIPAWTVGDRLRKAREAAGLTQAQLAAMTGISQRSISSYESSDKVRRPELVSCALATGVPLRWLETGSTMVTSEA